MADVKVYERVLNVAIPICRYYSDLSTSSGRKREEMELLCTKD
jgi:hypothetical protein